MNEAKGLIKLLKNPGESIHSLRELIGTSPERAGILSAFEKLVVKLAKNPARRPKVSKPSVESHRKPRKRKKVSSSDTENRSRLPEDVVARARAAIQSGVPLVAVARRFHTSPPSLRRAGLRSMRPIEKPRARRHRAAND
jgi:hypothetical protein